MDLDHAASAEGLGQTALLGDEERGRLSHGKCCSMLQLNILNILNSDVDGDYIQLVTNPKTFAR